MTGRRGGIRQGLILSTAFAAITFSSAVQAQEAKPASLWTQETLTGDWGGARTALKNRGIEFDLRYTNEVFDVMRGGIRREPSYEGQFHFGVDADLEKLMGWTGAKAHVTIFQIHDSGRNVLENTGSIADPSNLDALNTTRLYTLWLEQAFGDKLSVRFGQIVADGEFFTSDTAGGLINGTFGWPAVFASNITSGGPAYPLATPGVRVQYKLSDQVTLLGGVFSGNPAGGGCTGNPQACNRYGTTFSFDGGALWMGEAQYAVNQDKKSTGLAAAYKIGAWYATANYVDQRLGVDALGNIVSLANPVAAGPLNHRGNWGIYGVIDRMIWRSGEKSISYFVRTSGSPSDRNLLSYYIDAGIGFKGLLFGRNDDVFTVGAAYSKISKDASDLDRDTLAFNGPPFPIRSNEIVLEASYTVQIAPWWTLQPDLQYIVRPGGRVPDPTNPSATIGNALIAGLRSTIKF